MKPGASPLGAGGLIVSRSSRGRKIAGLLRRAYEYLVFYGTLMVFGLMSLAWSLVSALLYRLLPRRWGEPLGQHMIKAGCRTFVGILKLSGIIKCDLAALDALRREKALIIAANHPSLLDAVLLISRLPRVVCIAKSEIWDNLFLGGSARLAGFIRNDAPNRLIKQAARQVRAGHHLLIFPEGTRTRGGLINHFKGGFVLIGKQAGVPVQTVFIDSNSPFLGKAWPFFKKPDFPLVYRVGLGRRFEVRGNVRGFVAELEEYFRQELATRTLPPLLRA